MIDEYTVLRLHETTSYKRVRVWGYLDALGIDINYVRDACERWFFIFKNGDIVGHAIVNYACASPSPLLVYYEGESVEGLISVISRVLSEREKIFVSGEVTKIVIDGKLVSYNYLMNGIVYGFFSRHDIVGTKGKLVAFTTVTIKKNGVVILEKMPWGVHMTYV